VDAVELVHVHGGEPGLRRVRRGRGSAYLGPDGEPVADPAALDRIHALAIPPAWTDVWIAAAPNAHLQATGLDAKGRRQYRYHPAWRARRDREKFDDMLAFAACLPDLRRRAKALLAPGETGREHTLALAVRLLDVGFFRVGWDRYARDNGHVGLTTLRRDQVSLGDGEVRFDYVAKAGKRRRMTVRDAEAVVALRPLARRRGAPVELLVFRAPQDGWHRIQASDVNNALRAWGEGPYSAKEFRTWAGTVLAAVALAREAADGRRDKRAVNRAIRSVSTALGNTPAVARASYVDPRVIDAYADGRTIELPGGLPPAAVPLRIDAGDDGIVVELPTGVDGDGLRLEVERRVLDLVSSRSEPRRPAAAGPAARRPPRGSGPTATGRAGRRSSAARTA
jgi:DNA topoisomerase IB